jgi:NAD(P)-dependent dehydrogenase (short-subunit alcohol dehydrogenase family)
VGDKRAAVPIAVSQIDVDSDASVRDGIDAVLAEGPIDVLVNNAGRGGRWLDGRAASVPVSKMTKVKSL